MHLFGNRQTIFFLNTPNSPGDCLQETFRFANGHAASPIWVAACSAARLNASCSQLPQEFGASSLPEPAVLPCSPRPLRSSFLPCLCMLQSVSVQLQAVMFICFSHRSWNMYFTSFIRAALFFCVYEPVRLQLVAGRSVFPS